MYDCCLLSSVAGEIIIDYTLSITFQDNAESRWNVCGHLKDDLASIWLLDDECYFSSDRFDS